MCKYSTHLDYCGTAARSLGSKHANLMFSLLAGSSRARSMINPSKGGCLWGVTVLAELPLMDAHQAAVFGPTRLDPCAPPFPWAWAGSKRRLWARPLRHTSQARFYACTYRYPLFKPSFGDHCCTTEIIKGYLYASHVQLIDLMSEIQSRTNVCTQFSSSWALERFLGFGWCRSSPGSPLLYPSAPA